MNPCACSAAPAPTGTAARRRGGGRTPSRSAPGRCRSATATPPPSPSSATRPRSAPAGSNRCWPTPAGSTSPCTSNPVPPPVAAHRLRRQRARLESTRRGDADHGRLDDPELDAAADDAADLADRLARGDGRLFRVGLYLTVHAATPHELADRVAEVRAPPRPCCGRPSRPPGGNCRAGSPPCRSRSTRSGCAGSSTPTPWPPRSRSPAPTCRPRRTTPARGVLYGLNPASAGVVVWDRWAQDNHNSVVLARSGAGKSYLVKLDLLRNLYHGVHVAVIDPEDEYIALAEAVGGTVIRPGAPGVRINPLDLDPADGADALTRRALFLHTLIAVLLGDTTATAASCRRTRPPPSTRPSSPPTAAAASPPTRAPGAGPRRCSPTSPPPGRHRRRRPPPRRPATPLDHRLVQDPVRRAHHHRPGRAPRRLRPHDLPDELRPSAPCSPWTRSGGASPPATATNPQTPHWSWSTRRGCC